jgi:hypothetical protein
VPTCFAVPLPMEKEKAAQGGLSDFIELVGGTGLEPVTPAV